MHFYSYQINSLRGVYISHTSILAWQKTEKILKAGVDILRQLSAIVSMLVYNGWIDRLVALWGLVLWMRIDAPFLVATHDGLIITVYWQLPYDIVNKMLWISLFVRNPVFLYKLHQFDKRQPSSRDHLDVSSTRLAYLTALHRNGVTPKLIPDEG